MGENFGIGKPTWIDYYHTWIFRPILSHHWISHLHIITHTDTHMQAYTDIHIETYALKHSHIFVVLARIVLGCCKCIHELNRLVWDSNIFGASNQMHSAHSNTSPQSNRGEYMKNKNLRILISVCARLVRLLYA